MCTNAKRSPLFNISYTEKKLKCRHPKEETLCYLSSICGEKKRARYLKSITKTL